MRKSKTSAYLSLGICMVSSVLLLALCVTFPHFIHWFYIDYHMLSGDSPVVLHNVRTIVSAFYTCVPFAAAALYMLIRLLWNLLHERVFISRNVQYLRLVSWCCYAVALATGGFGLRYMPLFLIAFIMAVVGTLLRVVKNILHTAVTMREELDLTI